ncbi:ATP-binding protein [Azospirillum baldaniorum]|uniref:histidine kinase n=1 Tax=Azospirillum baldaniorum TaxID=1064539 RepID=A0A9P1JQV5_9PROT|nr:ATP-binding protein [Azospirillum baldaniorum]CCC97969.1 two-component hybrid sensor and regulator [Azospirillum baldaniorum]
MDRPDQELAELLDTLGARLSAAPPGALAHLREPLRALRDRLDAVVESPASRHPGEGEAHFRALLSDAIGCVSEGFVLFGADGRLVLCNDRYRAAYPLLSDHLVPGVRFADLLRVAVERGAAGDDLGDPSDWIAERLNRHIRSGPPTDHQLGDGRWYRISEHATRFGGVVKILTDITELKRHEEALADSEARYRRLVEMAPYGILIWDGLRLRFANRSAALILGSGDPEAMLRIPLVEATEFDGVQRLFDWLPPPGSGLEAPPPVEARFVTAQGALRELEVGIHPFAVEGEAAWFLVLTDITGRKQAERAIQQAQKMQAIGQLAGGIAHEFNNMLTAIGGFAQMARRAPQDRPRVEQCLTEIVKATDRASGLTAQLLSFGRPGQTDAARPVRVGAVIDDLRRFLGPTLGERHPLRIGGAGGGAVVTIDPALLHQSLLNLVLNARDAMPEGGPITIAVERTDDLGITITVADTGCGIDPAVIDRIFEPFFTTKEPGAGTGLGLALVYSTVARAGGDVEVDTELGRGTVFTLRFPAEDVAEPQDADAPGLDALGLDDAFSLDAEDDEMEGLSMAATVLLVEDEAQVRDFIRLTLEDMGMRVVCAADGSEALRAYADHGGAFDLLVTDLVMPQIGGASVARALRRENPDLPTVLMSGYPPETESLDDLLADPKSGGRRIVFLRKPINPDELADTIHALLI